MFTRKSVLLLASLLLLAGVLVLVLAQIPLVQTATSGAFAVFAPRPSADHAATSGYPNNTCPPAQSRNASTNDANWVRVIQFRLNYAFWPTGFPYFKTHPWLATDGSFGQKTEDAVLAYQAWEGIVRGGGAVGDRTWASLGFCQDSTVSDAFTTFAYVVGSNAICPPGQAKNDSGNTSEFVSALQDLLNQDYFNHRSLYSTTSPKTWQPYLGSDGSFGAQTYGAVYDYQASSRVTNGGGAVGDRTWAMLGMCYYTSVG